MVAIRLQRTGRKGHAMYRMVVQDARLTPTSGKVAAYLGHYDPHTKTAVIDKEKVAFYLEHGAQPSPRVAKLLRQEGVTLPEWVKEPAQKQSAIRSPEKLRKNRSKDSEPVEEPKDSEPTEEPAATSPEPEVAEEASAETEKDASETESSTTEATPDTDSPSNETDPKAGEDTSPEQTEASTEPDAEEAAPAAEPDTAKESENSDTPAEAA